MGATIAINQTVFRNDSTVHPRVTIGGYSETPFIKIADWQYIKAPGASFLIEPNNRSLIDCPVTLRDCFFDVVNWTLDAPGGGFSIAEMDAGFFRNGGDANGSWKGAYYDIELTGAIISIQAKATSTNLSTGISLQNTPFTSHDYFTDVEIAHAIIFGQNGQLTIREKGIKPVSQNVDFRYEVGDVALIEVDQVNDICRYYIVRGEEMVLLRTTRSKLTTNATAEIMLYFPGSALADILIASVESEESVVTFENIAVARRLKGTKEWQKWENSRTRISTADPIVLADGESEFTFPSSKKTLRQHALTPKTFTEQGFQDFEDFFNWHGNEKNFIFIDAARKDTNGNAQEFWSRFASGFTDTTKNACIFEHNVALIEAYRGDYIARQLDETAPVIALADDTGGLGFSIYIATATDNIGVKFVRFFLNGVQFGDDVLYAGDDTYEITINHVDVDPGTYNVTAKAYDYAGNETTSNTRVLEVPA